MMRHSLQVNCSIVSKFLHLKKAISIAKYSQGTIALSIIPLGGEKCVFGWGYTIGGGRHVINNVMSGWHYSCYLI